MYPGTSSGHSISIGVLAFLTLGTGILAIVTSVRGSDRYRNIAGSLIAAILLCLMMNWTNHETGMAGYYAMEASLGSIDPAATAKDLSIHHIMQAEFIMIAMFGLLLGMVSLIFRKQEKK